MTVAGVSAPNRPAQAPAANAAERPEAKPADAKMDVDVLKFRILPGAGAPMVSAKTDPTLGKTGAMPFILNKVEGLGSVGGKIANGVRFGTRLVGPAMYSVSAFWNLRMLPSVMRDKSLKPTSKAILGTASGFVTLGAIGSLISALPAKIASRMGLGINKLIAANKVSGMAGGLAGLGFSTINMVETLRDKTASPAKRMFAKLGFGLGVGGFLTGTTAMVLSMMGRANGVVGVLSKIATVTGITSLAASIGQGFLSKNKWLNSKVEGSKLA